MGTLKSLMQAYHFAAERHVNQRRKGPAGEPYMNHLTEVGELLGSALEEGDAEIMIAGILHDTLEDTATTRDELEIRFGREVAKLVAEVTDDKALPKIERKRLQIEHAEHASRGAKLIKLADKTANLRALLTSAPLHWPMTRKVEYLRWSRAVIAHCRGHNSTLERDFDTAAEALDRSLYAGEESF